MGIGREGRWVNRWRQILYYSPRSPITPIPQPPTSAPFRPRLEARARRAFSRMFCAGKFARTEQVVEAEEGADRVER